MLPREKVGSIECFIGYHTQEYRGTTLDAPVKCISDKAWLGDGYYFWLEEEFSMYWGEDFKTLTGFYDVYKAHIEDNGIMNMTFCEEDYFFVKNNINKLIDDLKAKGVTINLKEVHRLLKDKFWIPLKVNGIIYDDLPVNSYRKSRNYSLLSPFYYVKRIQLVVFNKSIIHNFIIYKEEQAS